MAADVGASVANRAGSEGGCFILFLSFMCGFEREKHPFVVMHLLVDSFSKKKILSIFREREREGERDGESPAGVAQWMEHGLRT